ncbi:MAG: hypothetical protein KY445_00535 [Armatimonadetes bacterium]|nr:hypothetical protein [Armatimonadota bacterium]
MMNHSTPSTHGAPNERAFEHSDVSWQTTDRRGGDRRQQERRAQPRRAGDSEDFGAALRQEIEEHRKLNAEFRETLREMKMALAEFRRSREVESEVERESADLLRDVAKDCRHALLHATDENREVKAEMRDSVRQMMDLLQQLSAR